MENQATFYVLKDKNKFEFCSKLCHQLWRKSHSQANPIIWILGDCAETIEALSELLWVQNQDSFIPHQTINQSYIKEKVLAPICLTLATPLPTWQGVLINLSNHSLTHFKNSHIIEIITNDNEVKKQARERYKHYKKSQFTIRHHDIQAVDKNATTD